MWCVTGRPVRVCRLLYAALLVSAVPGCNGPGLRTSGPTSADEDIWAIRCRTLHGADRVRLAESYAEALRQVAGLKRDLVQVFHEADESAVYYGRYRRRYDARSGAESFEPSHLRDLELIRQLSTTTPDPVAGTRIVWPFRNATMETLPTGLGRHPDWHLLRAPGCYSLQVAVFYNTEGMRQRKFAAEEYCRLLREQGEEAYYHHGAVNSIVCIGAFPAEAIQTYETPDPYTGIIRVTAKIVDQRMLELQKRFPYNLHNGHRFYETRRDPQTGQTVRDPHASFAVYVPRPGDQTDSLP